jgi:hypothetical protein
MNDMTSSCYHEHRCSPSYIPVKQFGDVLYEGMTDRRKDEDEQMEKIERRK